MQDAIAGCLKELAQTREMLKSRYDDLKSGRVKPHRHRRIFQQLRRREDELLEKPSSQLLQNRALPFILLRRRTLPIFGNALQRDHCLRPCRAR